MSPTTLADMFPGSQLSRQKTLRRRMHGIVLPDFERLDSDFPVHGEDLTSAVNRVARACGIQPESIAHVSTRVGRGHCAVVEFRDHPALFVKVATTRSFGYDNERALLSLLEDAAPTPTDMLWPQLVHWDPDHQILATRAVVPSQDWRWSLRNFSRDTVRRSALLGWALGRVHTTQVDVARLQAEERTVDFPLDPLLDLTPQELSRGSGADFDEFVIAVQAVAEEIATLQDSSYNSTLVHGDLRGANVLFPASSQHDTTGEVVFVDWEMAGAGDPRSDVGMVLAESLAEAVTTTGDILSHRSHVHALLLGYDLGTGSPVERVALFRYAGIHLLRAALGRLEHQGSLGRDGHLHLILGRALVARPDLAMEKLL